VLFGIPPSNMAQFRAQYGVPQEWVPIGAIAIGHPDPANDPVPPPRASQRKPLDELVHRGCW
jgi:nitroreductase